MFAAHGGESGRGGGGGAPRREAGLDPGSVDPLPPQHLGCHAVPASVLGRGTGRHLAVPHHHRHLRRRLRPHHPLHVRHLHERRGQRRYVHSQTQKVTNLLNKDACTGMLLVALSLMGYPQVLHKSKCEIC